MVEWFKPKEGLILPQLATNKLGEAGTNTQLLAAKKFISMKRHTRCNACDGKINAL